MPLILHVVPLRWMFSEDVPRVTIYATSACGLERGDAIPTSENLSNLFGFFKAMRTCHAKLQYFDRDGQVHLAKGKTGGQQGTP